MYMISWLAGQSIRIIKEWAGKILRLIGVDQGLIWGCLYVDIDRLYLLIHDDTRFMRVLYACAFSFIGG